MKKILSLLLIISFSSFGAIDKDKNTEALKNKIKPAKNLSLKEIPVSYNSSLSLLDKYKKNYSKDGLSRLKSDTLKEKFDAVPVLTKVMKDSSFPEKNRWLAAFMLGRIMGKKSVNFISKFTKHPDWMMRLAALKVLESLKVDSLKGIYARALKDPSMIVRYQALSNINTLKIKELSPHVWAMLYDKDNYAGNTGLRKRSNIIKDVIKTVGNLKFEKAKKPMLTMIQSDKYKDIFSELDEALTNIVGKASPKGKLSVKKYFWSKIMTEEITI